MFGNLVFGMRLVFVAILLLAFSMCSVGQSPSPVPTPDRSRVKNFGWSLTQYQNKRRKENSNAQDSRKTVDDPDNKVIAVKTDLVVDDVLVTDERANIITGLRKEDFYVSEDGERQVIETFSTSDSAAVPRSIVLILDCQTPQGPYLKESIAAAKALVDNLGPKDKLALVTADLKLRLDFTQDKSFLKNTLDSLRQPDPKVWGGLQFDALLATLNEMFQEKSRQKIVVLQGSGTEAMWLKQDAETPYSVSYSTLERSGLEYTHNFPKFGFRDLRESIQRSGATIYSIISGLRFVGLSKDEQLNQAKKSIADRIDYYNWKKEKGMLPEVIKYYQYPEVERNLAGQMAMFKVAELSGGNAGFIEKPEDADKAYADIFKIIQNRYVIGYYPINERRNGKLRQIKIEVRGHPEYTVTGRKAYFAPDH
jgi:VWFA-related protein